MNVQTYRRVRSLVEEASQLPPDARVAFVDASLPPGDPVRPEVLALLAALEDKAFLATTASASLVAAAFTPPEPPRLTQVGPYHVVKELGRGGMGIVYLATRNDDVFHKTVALKVVGNSAAQASFVERFREERQILAALDHPNIARILDGGSTDDGRPYYVMEYVDGVTLDSYCARGDADVFARVRLILQVCDALDYLHRQNVSHRDIKPANILVTTDGRVRLLDFGIAKAWARPQSENGRVTALATPGYASPEQIAGRDTGGLSDIYAVGAVLYELVSGHLPFADKEGRPDLAAQAAADMPARPSDAAAVNAAAVMTSRRAIPVDLDSILVRALQKEPMRRYGTIAHFADDLRRLLERRPIQARSREWRYVAALFVARNRVLVSLATLLVMALVAAGTASVRARMDRVRLEASEAEVRRLVSILTARVEAWARAPESVAPGEPAQVIREADSLLSSSPMRELSRRPPDGARFKAILSDVTDVLDRAGQRSRGETPVRRELAVAYQQIGDIASGESPRAFADRAYAGDAYRRATVVAAGLRSSDAEWARGQLDVLSNRMARVGLSLDEVLRAVDAITQSHAPAAVSPVLVPPSRPEPRPVIAEPKPLVPSAPTAEPVDMARRTELGERLRTVRRTAEQTRERLNRLRDRLASGGQAVGGDLTASMTLVDEFIRQAQMSFDENDLAVVADMLRRASAELGRVAAAVGG